jgi:hypothetical protein
MGRQPPGVDQALWNLGNAIGLPIDVVRELAAPDLDAISVAFSDAVQRWNVAAEGTFSSNRAYHRSTRR